MPCLTAKEARKVSEENEFVKESIQSTYLEREIELAALGGETQVRYGGFLYKPVRDKLIGLGYEVVDSPAYTTISW